MKLRYCPSFIMTLFFSTGSRGSSDESDTLFERLDGFERMSASASGGNAEFCHANDDGNWYFRLESWRSAGKAARRHLSMLYLAQNCKITGRCIKAIYVPENELPSPNKPLKKMRIV